jgi:hypothetical protein
MPTMTAYVPMPFVPSAEVRKEAISIPEMRMVATGPDFYCPDCKRPLLQINDDGGFLLSAKAGVLWRSGVIDAQFPPDEIEAIPQEVVCLRQWCRFKRWFRDAPKQVLLAAAFVVLGLVPLTAGLIIQYGPVVLLGMFGVWCSGAAMALIWVRLWLY